MPTPSRSILNDESNESMPTPSRSILEKLYNRLSNEADSLIGFAKERSVCPAPRDRQFRSARKVSLKTSTEPTPRCSVRCRAKELHRMMPTGPLLSLRISNGIRTRRERCTNRIPVQGRGTAGSRSRLSTPLLAELQQSRRAAVSQCEFGWRPPPNAAAAAAFIDELPSRRAAVSPGSGRVSISPCSRLAAQPPRTATGLHRAAVSP
jgi:hypothetical protein